MARTPGRGTGRVGAAAVMVSGSGLGVNSGFQLEAGGMAADLAQVEDADAEPGHGAGDRVGARVARGGDEELEPGIVPGAVLDARANGGERRLQSLAPALDAQRVEHDFA